MMPRRRSRARSTRRWARRIVALSALGGLGIVQGCEPSPDGGAWRTGEAMPGHTRPVLSHDWPHPTELALPAPSFVPPDPTAAEFETVSGVRTFILADPEDPVVAIVAAIASPRGPGGEEGRITWTRGALVRSLQDSLARRLDGMVGQTGVGEQGGIVRVRVEVPARHWRLALEGVVDALRDPHPLGPEMAAPPAAPSGGGMGRAVAELAQDHAATPDPASVPTVAGPTSKGVVDPADVVLGIGGGLDRASGEAALEEFTVGWEASGVAALDGAGPAQPSSPEPSPPSLRLVEHPGSMSWLALGHPMDPVAPGDEAAVAVMEEVLNIRLNIATRERRGLTNRALLVLPDPSAGGGLLHVRSSGRSESIGPILRYSIEEITRIREDSGAPTAEELSQVKGGLVSGRWQGGLDGPRGAAETFAVELAGHGSLDRLLAWPDAVLAVTASDVTAAARTYLRPDGMTAVVVGQIEDVRDARHPQWPFSLDEVVELLGARGPTE